MLSMNGRLAAAAAIALFTGQVRLLTRSPMPTASTSGCKVGRACSERAPITSDTDGKVIQLRAPSRAQDASTVPIAISTRVAQTPEHYIQKVYLLIDHNPSPIAAIFTFTPDSGRADIETRVRVEEYTWMRSIAEIDDGSAVHVSAICQGRGRLLRAIWNGAGFRTVRAEA